MLDKTNGFGFPQLRNRLPYFGNNLNLAIVSLQREDYFALLEEVDLMVENHPVYKNNSPFFKKVFRGNLAMAYRCFFEKLSVEDKDKIKAMSDMPVL